VPDVKDIAAGDTACPGNASWQAGRLIPCRNREADGMAAHAMMPELGCLPCALVAEHVCVGLADRVVCCLFPSLLVPFVSHFAIVADMPCRRAGRLLSG